jgi:hypothetical protein
MPLLNVLRTGAVVACQAPNVRGPAAQTRKAHTLIHAIRAPITRPTARERAWAVVTQAQHRLFSVLTPLVLNRIVFNFEDHVIRRIIARYFNLSAKQAVTFAIGEAVRASQELLELVRLPGALFLDVFNNWLFKNFILGLLQCRELYFNQVISNSVTKLGVHTKIAIFVQIHMLGLSNFYFSHHHRGNLTRINEEKECFFSILRNLFTIETT